MYSWSSIKSKLFLFSLASIFLSCESEPITINSSFTDDNSFMMESFAINMQDSYSFQDDSVSVGNSYRLYTGNIDDVNSRIFMKINTTYLIDSKYCLVDTVSYSDSTLHSIDSLQLALRSFDEIMDEDSLILIDTTALEILSGLSTINDWNEDSLLIFSQLEVPQILTPIINSNIEFGNYTLDIKLPFDDNWCTSEDDYYIVISYAPDPSHEFQCLELTSSEYSSGISNSYRPSLDFSYNQFNEIIEYIDRFSINESLLELDDQDIYHVYNDTLSTKSKFFIVKDMNDDFNEWINAQEVYLNDISMGSSFFSSSEDDPYEVKLTLDLTNQDIIPDSISNTIDFILDSIIVIPNNSDPSGDNSSSGTEGNNQFDDNDDGTELFSDLGFDWCPDLYESGTDTCLCDFVNDYDSCDLIDEFVYNQGGTEGNEIHDTGEEFPLTSDTGVDGCSDEYEGGLNDVGNPICLDEPNPDHEDGSDPNEDNYLSDPSGDNWNDCGEDGLCDEEEEEYDSELNTDPSNDNWGSENVYGTEGNGLWDEGEGLEGNGQYDSGESYHDWGIDGMPEEEEINCTDCVDDSDTEDNGVYDYGEPYQDTGIDSVYTVNEEGYNPTGTEGNKSFDVGEDMPSEYDCGEDGICDDGDTSDDYNIDPNNDNWNDCGSDSDCGVIDEDETQDNGEWNEGELYQGNNQFDSTDSGSEFYYDWGIDQLADSLEVLQTDNLLTYSAPSTITYSIGEEMDINNSLDESKDILFDIKEIIELDNGNIQVAMDITANKEFKAIQFRLNHSPYINETTELVHYNDVINQIDQNELIEDMSMYDNLFELYDFSSDSTLILDYLNGIRFSLKFPDLSDFINNNPGVSINDSYTTLGLYPDYENSNYNFFDNQINIWVKIGDENRFLTSVTAASHNEVLIPFGPVIEDLILGDIDLNDDIIFLIDGVYDNRSRIVFHKNHETLSPHLEIFYSE